MPRSNEDPNWDDRPAMGGEFWERRLDCPRCGKPEMDYARFLLEAEPYKVLPCGSCGAPRARSRQVWLSLAVISVGLVALVAVVAPSGVLEVITPCWLPLLLGGGVLGGWSC